MTDEWTMSCKEVPSGNMGMVVRLVQHGQLICFEEQEVGPESIKWTVNCWHPGYPAASSSSQVYLVYLESLSAKGHCNLGPISLLTTMKNWCLHI